MPLYGPIQPASDGANAWAIKQGTASQTLRVYETTDASATNYSRLNIIGGANHDISATQAGTGSARSIRIFTTGAASLQLGANNSINWVLNATGHLTANVDNTYDIGSSGAGRPRNLYMASWIRYATTTVGALPAAATAGAGARMFVTDALTPVFGSAVVAGGAVTVPVYSTGSAWNVG